VRDTVVLIAGQSANILVARNAARANNGNITGGHAAERPGQRTGLVPSDYCDVGQLQVLDVMAGRGHHIAEKSDVVGRRTVDVQAAHGMVVALEPAGERRVVVGTDRYEPGTAVPAGGGAAVHIPVQHIVGRPTALHVLQLDAGRYLVRVVDRAGTAVECGAGAMGKKHEEQRKRDDAYGRCVSEKMNDSPLIDLHTHGHDPTGKGLVTRPNVWRLFYHNCPPKRAVYVHLQGLHIFLAKLS